MDAPSSTFSLSPAATVPPSLALPLSPSIVIFNFPLLSTSAVIQVNLNNVFAFIGPFSVLSKSILSMLEAIPKVCMSQMSH